MPTAKDPPALAHHIRISGFSDEMLHALAGLKDWCVVSHQGGSKGEHPHLHCYVKHTVACTKVTVKTRLKKLSVFEKYSGNEDWSFRAHTSFEAWWEYVFRDPYRNKRPKLEQWTIEGDAPAIPEPVESLVYADNRKHLGDGPTTITLISPQSGTNKKQTGQTKTKSSLDKQKQFLEYCQMRWEGKERTITKVKISKYLLDYCTGLGFSPYTSLATWANYAYYNMTDKEERKLDAPALARKLFPEYSV